MTASPIVLAAGGTGGHMFPAEALARALLGRGRRVVLVTDRRGQAFGNSLPDVPIHRIRAAQIGRGAVGKACTLVELVLGYGQARGLLRALGPAAVVGFGGYASAPTVHAAGRLGLPVVLHEQNAVLGRANRWLAKRAGVIATSFPEVKGLEAAGAAAAAYTGNPVRPAVARVRDRAYAAPDDAGSINVLVIGGSQGAAVFSDLVPSALSRLPKDLRRRLRVSQQVRQEDLQKATAAYRESGIERELASFFTDVPERLADAHLVIARAGASTVSELAVAGRPALLVPYPFATDNHQAANAAALADAGGGWLQLQDSLTPQSLSATVEALLSQPRRLAEAAEAAHRFGIVDAADRLADAVERLAGLTTGGGDGDNGSTEPRLEAAE